MTQKYIFDRLASALGLLLLWPVLLATALYVRLSLPGGPVLFRQAKCKELLAYLIDRQGANVSRR